MEEDHLTQEEFAQRPAAIDSVAHDVDAVADGGSHRATVVVRESVPTAPL